MNFLFVALGGALGAMARYAISIMPVKSTFPMLTFITKTFLIYGFSDSFPGYICIETGTRSASKSNACPIIGECLFSFEGLFCLSSLGTSISK